MPRRRFDDLSEREILALAITLEEEDGRIYADFADGLRAEYPGSADLFEAMRQEEAGHRAQLLALYQERFGDHLPFIRREDVKGFVTRRPTWLVRPLGLDTVRRQAAEMELETRRFYERAARRTTDPAIRALLDELAEAERGHINAAATLERQHVPPDVRQEEEASERRLFLLQVVQPGLVGLMDGSVSTLAPLFAAAFATHDTWETFLVGLAASIGAGISMGFAEALSDDGSLTGRGRPWIRGTVSGLMTAVGGLGHALPYLIPDFQLATGVAVGVVVVELWAISYIRYKYMDTPFLAAAFQIVLGGALVFLSGILIGSA
ncbi:MAG: iron exporter MbfA [Vicinamibacterales bacterium]